MRHNTINGLLRDAMNALRLGRAGLALRMLKTAEAIALNDAAVSAELICAVHAARLATADAI